MVLTAWTLPRAAWVTSPRGGWSCRASGGKERQEEASTPLRPSWKAFATFWSLEAGHQAAHTRGLWTFFQTTINTRISPRKILGPVSPLPCHHPSASGGPNYCLSSGPAAS